MTGPITRRAVTAGLGAFGAGFGAGFGLTRRARAEPEALSGGALEEAARREGAVTWYVAQTDGQTAEQMGRAFTARHPGIAVTVIRTTGQVAYQRLSLELKSGKPQCDVLSSTDVSQYRALAARGALARYVPPNAAAMAPPFARLAVDGLYYPTSATVHVLAYNTETVPPADVPKTWLDLVDPKWRGQVAVGHPGYSGYTGIWVIALRQLYGWDYFAKLARNQPMIGRSALDAVTMLNARERKVACGPLSAVLRSADLGNPIAIAYPSDGAVLCIGPSAVIAGAPHPNAARLFMDWLLGVEFAQLLVDTRSDPVRADVPPKPGAKPLADVALLAPTEDEVAKGIPEIIEQWRDTFGG